MKKIYTLLGLLYSGQALAQDNYCTKTSLLFNTPRTFEKIEFPGINHNQNFCNSFLDTNYSISLLFQESDIEKQLNFESSIKINPHQSIGLFINYENPIKTINTGILLSTEIIPNMNLNLTIPINEKQLFLGLEYKF